MIVKTVVRPETEMKNSGIDWISSIPKDWKIPQVRNFFEINRGRVIAKTEINELYKEGLFPVYSSQTKDNGCMGYIDSYDFEKEGLTWTTDGAYAGTVFYRKGKYNCTNVCGILTLKDGFDVSVPFCKYSIGWSAMNCRRADINGYKIMSNEMAAIKFVMPPLFEQQAIADYLDETCSKIDEIIAEAKASIDEYKELRQGIIFEAVTKGLDKNVEMKSTSVGWIGMVPSHWRVAKIRQVAEFYNGDRSSKYPSGDDIVSEGIIFITSNNLGYIVLNTNISTNKFITKQKYDDLGGAKLRINDIVFCLRGSVGKCAINKTFDEGTIASSLVVIRAKKVDADYLNYVLQNHRITDEAIVNAIGIGSLNLAAHDISEFYMPIPPEREMQDIVRYLDDKVGNVDDLISEKESLIADLEAYKKSLIYEVVTGKRRVV